MELDLNGELLPFLFDLSKEDSGHWVMHVHNGEEDIVVRDVILRNDSILVRMPLFDSEFKGVLHSEGWITGVWNNYLKGPDYHIPFSARSGVATRFPGAANDAMNVGGVWEVHFNQGSADAYNAIGIFGQRPDGRVTGTFETETGDYRYLEGVAHNDSLKLSCFDGSHAFLFTAALRGDSLSGRFWSGTHWQEPWVAVRNPGYHLRNADSLTFLREGYDMLDFHFPDLNGAMVSSKDPRFVGHPMMVQVMGSWCPNCVDETRLLNEMYAQYHDQGLEVVAIAFEKYNDPVKAVAGLRRFRDVLAVEYPILYGGLASKEEAGAKLPFLDHIMSYPTCVFVDRNGTVRRIRTGFYGPGTGEHYVIYKRN
ncbi:MAG TPA: TlpA disulfide reductase family protein, partial [Flavobacteriales bacterium]|nr:TlpA disulfide reductase family protein [Flavobacteriales bacterium]